MEKSKSKTKVMIVMLIIVGIVFGGVFAFKSFKSHMIAKYIAANQNPPVTVSSIKVDYAMWQPLIQATGTTRAVKGVDVTTDAGGMVTNIYFTPGAKVQEGTLLAKLYIADQVALLHSDEAQAELAGITYNRDVGQYAAHAIPKQQLDNDLGTLKSDTAQVQQQTAVIEKMIIRAPFSGRLGISQVNPGQYVNPGDKVVTLQALDPIWMDFYVPEQYLAQLAVGQTVNFTTDTFPGQTFTAKITTINPIVDNETRNVTVEATVANPKEQLLPGLFTDTQISAGKPQSLLTVPQTAVSFYPYGNVMYVINQSGKDKQGKPIYTVAQRFVTIGKTRGDQIAIEKGVKADDVVVTSGQLKLQDGSHVIINNQTVPSDNAVPPKAVDSNI